MGGGCLIFDQFLARAVFSKSASLRASVPLSKRLTFAKEPGTKKPGEELTATAAEMEQTALKAVINLVEVSQLVDLPQLVEHRVVEEYMALVNSNGTYRKSQKSKFIQKLSLSFSLSHTHTHTRTHARTHTRTHTHTHTG